LDKIKVLVIDDKQVIGDLFEFALRYEGHEVTFIKDPHQALEGIRSKEFDVAFVDLVMPDEDGVDVLSEIKKIKPSLPVVMMSGYAIEERRKKALECGAVCCINKPFELDEIRRVIQLATGKQI
jgi:DNA-binding NtrC family response regulator